MRQVIEATLVSIDGVIGDPPVWAGEYFDKEAERAALEQLLVSDAMLMGRRTYEMFAAMSLTGTGDYADRMNRIRKYVFSSTLEKADWDNTTIIGGDAAAAVADLKRQDGRPLVMYGHGPLGQTLLAHRLLDELRFMIHPVFVGQGTLLFREIDKTALRLVGTTVLETGVVVLSYQPADQPAGG
jgi:dihydrofolate reductase